MIKKAVLVGFLWLLFIVAAYAQTPSVVLGWNASPTMNISGYFIYRNTMNAPWGSPGWMKVNVSGPTTVLTYTDVTVVAGMTYYYAVTAYRGSDDSESAPTNVVSAMVGQPPPQPASNLRVIQVNP